MWYQSTLQEKGFICTIRRGERLKFIRYIEVIKKNGIKFNMEAF